ncbi:MAG TPA: class I SAM-dependent methyltransferase [Chryseosolibacter sp.]
MTRSNLAVLLACISIVLVGCAKSLSYEGGPVMKQKHIHETFTPILQFLEVKPGMHFADVGAGNGALPIMMSTLMNDVTVYVQDIDTKALTQHNLDKIIAHYSRKSKQDLAAKNRYRLVIGDLQHTNLPDRQIDLIYSNATIHVFDSPNEMLQDIRKKLAPGGRVFFRDSFRNDNGEGEFCSDKTCAKRLLAISEFLELMDKNGYKLVKQSANMSGYPVFGFAVAE